MLISFSVMSAKKSKPFGKPWVSMPTPATKILMPKRKEAGCLIFNPTGNIAERG
jgi:hypothetical protein